jgi:SAM-dependent methyltransferase
MPFTIEQQKTYAGNAGRNMTSFERRYLWAEHFLPPLHPIVRRRLLGIVQSTSSRPSVLDVGGRKSHYTVGVPADIVIADLPRETDIQEQLNLGINDKIVSQIRQRRSNIVAIQIDDMTHSLFCDGKFDCVLAIEVLEHVEKDVQFIHEVSRVLKPGGVFLMTTPNGESVKNTNPDHRRHYSRSGLEKILHSAFDSVRVEYAIKSGLFYNMGLNSWSLRHPFRTAMAMFGAVVNSVQSGVPSVSRQAVGTQELIAEARKNL